MRNITTRTQAEKYTLVARRRKTVPVMITKLSGMYDDEKNAAIDDFVRQYAGKLGFSLLSADGVSDTAAIARQMAFEFGVYDPAAVDAYVRLLIKLELAEEVC